MSEDSNISPYSLIADFDGNVEDIFNVDLQTDTIPVIPLRNMAIFPGIVVPVAIERTFSVEVVRKAMKQGGYMGVVTQLKPETEDPGKEDIYDIGTIVKVIRILELPQGRITALLQGFCRFNVVDITKRRGVYKAQITTIHEENISDDEKEFVAIIDSLREHTNKLVSLNEGRTDESNFALSNIKNNIFLLNFICTNINFKTEEKIKLLRIDSPKERALGLLTVLNTQIQFATLRANIQRKTKEELDQQQREYFLQQEIRNIQEELGNGEADEIAELHKKLLTIGLPEPQYEVVYKEIRKLEHMPQQSPDYNVQYNYLQTILNLPWYKYSEDYINLEKAEKTLNSDHYGLQKVKERILEYLSVIQTRGDFKSPILCLYGPPGIGKTSLGKSIATAMGRKYVRVSLGGLHDEAEIRGHRRTYIGAMPGRIIKGIMKCGTANPVFVLDEIDKVTRQTFNGDPTSALLEVLDPEQNSAFHDNYIDMDFDLSKVMFIATANNIGDIPAPLRDRMELIEMSGYITEEKIEIARRHLVPKAKKENGINIVYHPKKINKQALEYLIEHYTRESGVRTLEKKINEVFRKIVYQTSLHKFFRTTDIRPSDIEYFLGKPTFTRDIYEGNSYAGVVTGLAWTSVGGEILFIETSLSRGKGGKLSLTGNLGDVMKESATIALEYIKAHASDINIDYRIFDNYNIHIHVPEGATPKDGPSAGITIATSIASALTQRKVRNKTAMTGEITLRGKVLPVGGIKEKILAAKRAGIETIVMCKDNKKDIDEIPHMYLDGINFKYVENVNDVLKFALLDEKVDNPMEFVIEDTTPQSEHSNK